MPNVAFLETYSEIAVAIVGFSGVVVALRGREASETQKISLSMLILFGSTALVLGILPQILLTAGVTPAVAWQGLSLFVVLLQLVGGVTRNRQAKNEGVAISVLGGVAFVPIMLSSTVVAAANVYFGEFWIYMANLLLYLLASISIFGRLVGLGSDDA